MSGNAARALAGLPPVSFTGEVHPVAALFPMLAENELAELAEDITARGLLQPLMLDEEGRLIDGRNRLAACEIAGVEPEFDVYLGDDAAGYALTVNITRRHLTTGARAVIAEQARRLNGVAKLGHSRETGIDRHRYAEAGEVLDWEPALVPEILAGVMSLSRAVEEARERKRSAEAVEAILARLQDEAPDLATRVEDEQLDIDEACTLLNARITEAEAQAREAEMERRRLHDEAQAESAAAVRRFSAIAGQLIGTVDPDEWRLSPDEWRGFLAAVEAVSNWRKL